MLISGYNKKIVFIFFFFKQKTAYEITASDWSSDVCSSDLAAEEAVVVGELRCRLRRERARAREPAECLHRGRGARLDVVPAVDELKRLRQELDVDEPAPPVLDVPASARFLAQLNLHARAHLCDL